jgi:putative ABC transport system permease protein
MNKLRRDVRYGVRQLAKQPLYALLALLTLALGIGANTAIFTVLNAALFKPLPIADENQVVVVQEFRRDKGDGFGVSYLDFSDWRSQSQSFSSISIVTTDEATLKGEGEPVRVRGAVVSADIFQTLGRQPYLGRAFTPADEAPGTQSGPGEARREGLSPLMLSYSAWQQRFGGARQILGSQLIIDNQPFQVIGITPPDLFPLQQEPVEFWVTTAINGNPQQQGTANGSRGYRFYDGAVARLKPGVSVAQAQAELDLINANIQQQNPGVNKTLAIRVMSLRQLLVGDAGKLLWLLLGVVGVVLLIACINVANLLLARAAARQREIAIRTALGATRWDIVRQFLTESLLLSVVGGVLGLVLSLWLVAGCVALLPAEVPRLTGLTPDVRVWAFTFGVALLTGLLCGLLPAMSATKSNLADAIKEGGRTGAGGAFQRRWRAALVVGEVALALTLLVAAGLLINSLLRLNRVNPGYRTEATLTAQLVLSDQRYFTDDMKPERLNSFLDTLTARVKQLPGVREVSYAQCVPLTDVDNNTNFGIVERPGPPGETTVAQLRFIGAAYFDTLAIPVKRGRTFTANDNPQTPDVALINEAFARTYFKDEDPLGKHLKMGWGGDGPKEIVGVVGDVRHRSLSDAARPEMYVPQAQFANAGITLLVSTSGSPETLINPLRQTVRALDPELPLKGIKTLAAYRDAALAVPRFNTILLSGFACLALMLTLIGLYGMLSYSVTQRTQEIGIRMALGAQTHDVLRLVLGQGLKLVAVGVGLGLIGAWAVTRTLQSYLYGVSPADPLTYLSVAALLVGVALLACWLPARRATQVNPLTALHYE